MFWEAASPRLFLSPSPSCPKALCPQHLLQAGIVGVREREKEKERETKERERERQKDRQTDR